MTEQERLENIRNFLNREDLEGTNLKLKTKVIDLDKELAQARLDNEQLKQNLKEAQSAINNKGMQIMGLAERLDGLCELIVDIESTFPVEELEDTEDDDE